LKRELEITILSKNWKLNLMPRSAKHPTTYAVIHVMKRLTGIPFR